MNGLPTVITSPTRQQTAEVLPSFAFQPFVPPPENRLPAVVIPDSLNSFSPLL
jgi:hypothetical protein